MACRFELGAQLAEVVDLAVEHDPDGTVLVVDRLMAGREIDDAQAPHAERDALVVGRWALVRRKSLCPLVSTKATSSVDCARVMRSIAPGSHSTPAIGLAAS